MAPTSQQTKSSRVKSIATGKQPKARVARYLKTTESQLVEGARSVLLMKGIRCSDAMATVLKDMRAINAPHSKLLTKNNVIIPFSDEGQQSIEFLTTKNDCSLFAVASHNKKRPNNLVMGRTFDRHIIDMVELGIVRYKSLKDYGGAPKKRIGSKPMMLFVGDRWHLDHQYRRLQNLFLDFYRGDPVEKLVMSGLDHIMVFTIADGIPVPGSDSDPLPAIHQRTYYSKLKKDPAGGKAPIQFLTPSGPDLDFRVRRTEYAAPDVWKAAMKQPAAIKKKAKKNHTTNIFGETVGRLHLDKQDIDRMQGRKVKALRIAAKIEGEEEKQAVESELEREEAETNKQFRQTFGFGADEMGR